MKFDPIVEEIHEIRSKLSQQYGDDLHAICEAFRRGQDTTKHQLISRAPRPALHSVHAPSNPSFQRIAFGSR
jgi:hypothetical protein